MLAENPLMVHKVRTQEHSVGVGVRPALLLADSTEPVNINGPIRLFRSLMLCERVYDTVGNKSHQCA